MVLCISANADPPSAVCKLGTDSRVRRTLGRCMPSVGHEIFRFRTPLLFSTLTRIYLLYLGGVCILVGLVIFWAFCPRPVRLYQSRRQYVEAVQGDRDSIESLRAGKSLIAVAHTFSPTREINGIRQRQVYGILVTDEEIDITVREPSAVLAGAAMPTLAAYYEMLDRSRALLSSCCLFFLSLGGLLFLLPSLEVFLMAIGHMWGHMRG